MSKYVVAVVAIVSVLALGSIILADDGDNGTSATAEFYGVPSEILVGIPGEDAGIIPGYVDGRRDAKAGRKPFSCSIPQPYHYGYSHGYADNSALSFTDAFNLSSDNAFNVYWEEMNHE